MDTMGIGEAVKQATGIRVRIMPGGTELARLMPLLQRDAHFAYFVGSSTFPISHGLGTSYSKEEWGPQPIRVVWNGMAGWSAMVVRGDSGIKTMADLKGKRIGVVPGHAMFEKAPRSTHAAVLAFAGLTWDDVTAVPVKDSTAMFKGILEGSVDSGFLPTDHATAYELEASPHGIYFPPMPSADKEAWARFQKIAPYISPSKCPVGAGIKEGKTVELSTMPYPFVAYEWLDENIAYAYTKAVWGTYDVYKKARPRLEYFTHEETLNYKSLSYPYHDGAVKFFKEVGVWTPAMESWQKKQVDLEKARMAAWQDAKVQAGEKKIALSTPAFEEFWLNLMIEKNLISYPEP